MKRMFFFVCFSVHCFGAACSYEDRDFQTFCAMQVIAQKYFTEIDSKNEKTTEGLGRPLHSLVDKRSCLPYKDEKYQLEQGVLFEPGACKLYSRFGCWQFAGDYLFKYVRPVNTRGNWPWQAICEAVCRSITGCQFDEWTLQVIKVDLKAVPDVRLAASHLTITEHSLSQEHELEDQELRERNQEQHPFVFAHWYQRLHDIFYSLVGRLRNQREQEATQDIVIERVPDASAQPEYDSKPKPISDEMKALWHEMCERYARERTDF